MIVPSQTQLLLSIKDASNIISYMLSLFNPLKYYIIYDIYVWLLSGGSHLMIVPS